MGPKKIRFPIILENLSLISLGNWDIVRGQQWAHFAENHMPCKILVPELRTGTDHISHSFRENGTPRLVSPKRVVKFSIRFKFLRDQMLQTHCNLTDFQFNPKIECTYYHARKGSGNWIFDFLEFNSSDFLHITQSVMGP